MLLDSQRVGTPDMVADSYREVLDEGPIPINSPYDPEERKETEQMQLTKDLMMS